MGFRRLRVLFGVALLPGFDRVLIFFGRSLCYRGNLIHRDASLGWSNLDFKLAIGDAEDLSLTTLPILLDNKILGS